MTTPDQQETQTELKIADEQLQAAQELLARNFFRPAISVTYYAIFHAARAALWSRSRNAKTHRGLAEQFRQEFIVSQQLDPVFLEIMNRGQRQREKADYTVMDVDNAREQAHKIFSDARKFVEKMKEIIR